MYKEAGEWTRSVHVVPERKGKKARRAVAPQPDTVPTEERSLGAGFYAFNSLSAQGPDGRRILGRRTFPGADRPEVNADPARSLQQRGAVGQRLASGHFLITTEDGVPQHTVSGTVAHSGGEG